MIVIDAAAAGVLRVYLFTTFLFMLAVGTHGFSVSTDKKDKNLASCLIFCGLVGAWLFVMV